MLFNTLYKTQIKLQFKNRINVKMKQAMIFKYIKTQEENFLIG
jgi:hypothetical protein